MKRKNVLIRTMAALLLASLFSAKAEILYSPESVGLSLDGTLTLSSGTSRSPQEFTQPVKIGEALQVSFSVNMNTIKSAMQAKGYWNSAGLFQGYHHQFVFYPHDLKALSLVISEPEGNASVFQANSHPEIGLTFAIKDNSFPAVPLLYPHSSGYLCFFGSDAAAPMAQCGYREAITSANLAFTSRLYLLPPRRCAIKR